MKLTEILASCPASIMQRCRRHARCWAPAEILVSGQTGMQEPTPLCTTAARIQGSCRQGITRPQGRWGVLSALSWAPSSSLQCSVGTHERLWYSCAAWQIESQTTGDAGTSTDIMVAWGGLDSQGRPSSACRPGPVCTSVRGACNAL